MSSILGQFHAPFMGTLESLGPGKSLSTHSGLLHKGNDFICTSLCFSLFHLFVSQARLSAEVRKFGISCVLVNRICPSSMTHGHGGRGELCEYLRRQRWCDGWTIGKLCHMVSPLLLESGPILARPESGKHV